MTPRLAIAGMVAVALAVSRNASPQPGAGSQASPRVTLVNVPIPAYAPIAQSAMVSGDVQVTVDVRADGTVASASIVALDDPSRSLGAAFLEKPALEAARNARFSCQGCGEATQPYSLLFAFRFAHQIGRAEGDTHPEVLSISPSQSRILIVVEAPLAGEGPTPTRGPKRAATCLWLWHCENLRR